MNPYRTLRTAAERLRGLARRLAWLAPLATRIVLGLAFVQAGLGKFQHFDGTVRYFSSLGIPVATFSAGLVATMELVGGAALLAGFLSRLMASCLAVTMIVALLTAEGDAFLRSWSPGADIAPSDVLPFRFLLLLAWVALYGPGTASLDALLARWRGRGVTGAAPPA